MNVNYEDERFKNLETEKQTELDKYNQTYDNLIAERNEFTNQQQALVDQWQQTQTDIANKNLQHQTDLYNQQKQKAEESFREEARASYDDYLDEVDRYGVSRENMVANGLSNSGYSETSRTNMYVAYQNRVASARASLKDAQLEFDNAIKEAQLTNNAALAELALQTLQQKLDIALEGFNYKDTQTQNKLNWQNEINNNYYKKYQDVLDQINYENQQKEAIRQWEEEMKFQREQLEYQKQQDAISNAQRWAASSNNYGGYEPLGGSESLGGGSVQQIKTNYYSGAIHPDTKYGTFSSSRDLNGVAYQPNNVGGNKLSKSGLTVKNVFTDAYGLTGANLANQNIWKTSNGKYYVWDGSRNDYIDITTQVKNSQRTRTTQKWGW